MLRNIQGNPVYPLLTASPHSMSTSHTTKVKYQNQEIELAQSVEIIQTFPLIHELTCMCIFVDLCNFVTCRALRNHHHNKGTELYHHHKDSPLGNHPVPLTIPNP